MTLLQSDVGWNDDRQAVVELLLELYLIPAPNPHPPPPFQLSPDVKSHLLEYTLNENFNRDFYLIFRITLLLSLF